ncbi:hypothetical protein ACFL6G_08580 [candidate division KSB1 bacterium]
MKRRGLLPYLPVFLLINSFPILYTSEEVFSQVSKTLYKNVSFYPLQPVYNFTCSESNPEIAYMWSVGDEGTGIYKTMDGCKTWEFVKGQDSIGDIVIDPNNPEIVYSADGT